jgi:hypothetical protein
MRGRLSRSIAILLTLAAGCHVPASVPPPLEAKDGTLAARGPSFPLAAATASDGNATTPLPADFVPCPGVGAPGAFVRALFPADDEMGPGLGVGMCGHMALALVTRSELGVWAVGDAAGDEWGAMGEFSLGLGGPAWPVHLLAGAGLALPLLDEGALDLNSALFAYAGAWFVFDCGAGWALSLSARYAWYSEEATLVGAPRDLDGWSVAFSCYF